MLTFEFDDVTEFTIIKIEISFKPTPYLIKKVDDICVKVNFLLSRSMCILPTTQSQLKVIFVCLEGNNLLS